MVSAEGEKQTSEATHHWLLLATQDYTIQELFDAELRAVEKYDWNDMAQRFRSFRNGLMNVALDFAPLLATLPSAPAVGLPGESPPKFRVLIVDDSSVICDVHTALIQNFRPSAVIQACHRSEPPCPLLCSFAPRSTSTRLRQAARSLPASISSSNLPAAYLVRAASKMLCPTCARMKPTGRKST